MSSVPFARAAISSRRIARFPPFEAGDRVALLSAGAYGFVMSSNYNSRPLLPEVLVEGDRWRVIRERQNYDDLIRGENL